MWMEDETRTAANACRSEGCRCMSHRKAEAFSAVSDDGLAGGGKLRVTAGRMSKEKEEMQYMQTPTEVEGR